MRDSPSAEPPPSPDAAAPPGAAVRRRPSWQGRLINLLLGVAVRRSLGRRGLHELPAMRARLDRMGTKLPMPANVLREQDRLDDVPAEWTRIHGVSDPRRTVLYLHGGAFILGSPRMYRGLTADLAQRLAAEVVAIDYRLAPEHPFPAALQDAEHAYRHLLARGQLPERLVVMGDSAGGNLTLAFLQRLRNAGLPMPAAAAVFSPWLDLAAEYGTATVRDARDPMLPAERIREAAGLYHGSTAADDPLVSPAGLDFDGLPPLLVQVGERELLRPAIEHFVARGQAHGADVTLRCWAGMPHVFQAFARYLPEGREALADVAAFVHRHVPTLHAPAIDAGAGAAGARPARGRPGHDGAGVALARS